MYRLQHLPPANLLHICNELKAAIANGTWVAHTEKGTSRPGQKCTSPCVTSSRKTTPLGDKITGSWCYTAAEPTPFPKITLVASKTECSGSETWSNQVSVHACASKCASEYFAFGRKSGRCSGSTCKCVCETVGKNCKQISHPHYDLYHKPSLNQGLLNSWGEVNNHTLCVLVLTLSLLQCGGCPRGTYRKFKDGVKCTGTCPYECVPTEGGTCIDDTYSLKPKMPSWAVINVQGAGRRANPSAKSHRYSCTSCPIGKFQTEPSQNTEIGNFAGCTGLNIGDIASGKTNWGKTPDKAQKLKCSRDATISPKFEKVVSKFPLLCSKAEYQTRLIRHPNFYGDTYAGGSVWYAAKCLMQKTIKCKYGDPMKCSVQKSALCLEVCKGRIAPWDQRWHSARHINDEMKRAFTRSGKECYPGCFDPQQKGGSIIASGWKNAKGNGNNHIFTGESIEPARWCRLPILGY